MWANSCKLSSNPSAEYNWWSTTIKHSFRCFLYKESIIASSEYGIVLGTNCIAKTLTCELEESRLVWNETVFHTCPYYEIDHTGKFFTKNNFLINKEESLLLEPTGESIKCKDTVLYKTEQGLFWDILASLKTNSQFLKEIKN